MRRTRRCRGDTHARTSGRLSATRLQSHRRRYYAARDAAKSAVPGHCSVCRRLRSWQRVNDRRSLRRRNSQCIGRSASRHRTLHLHQHDRRLQSRQRSRFKLRHADPLDYIYSNRHSKLQQRNAPAITHGQQS